MQKIAVVQSLQTQVVKLQIALGLKCCGQARKIEVQHLGGEQFLGHTLRDKAWKVAAVGCAHVGAGHILADGLARDGVQQQARGDQAVVRVFLNQGARCQDGGLEHLVHVDSVIQIAQGLAQDRRGINILA